MHFLRLLPLLLLLCANSAAALDPFVVKDIRVEGIQRIEAGTVFSYLPVKVGETLTEAKASEAIRALFATGFFKDVSLEVQGGVLIVVVQERPSIAQIEFTGMKEFEKDAVLKALRQTGLSEGRVFDKGLLDRAEQELKRQYLSRGMYAVNVTTTVTPLERNRAAINFNVEEGDIAKIRQISVIGANAFSEKDLLKVITLRTPGWFTWYSKLDQYSRQRLAADLETLRSYYLDRGYLEFNIDSTQVSISPDRKDIYITIGITEGPVYKVKDIKLGGEVLVPEEELMKLVKVQPGDVFSRSRLTESTKLISDRLGDEGYAFANVNAVPQQDKEKREVAFTFFIDPGRRVYVRRINVTGNNRTRDEVIRREMRQFEGGWYSGSKINTSRQRIDKLGYFTEVNIETPAVPGTTDQVDLNVSVAEKPTGVFLLGAGFGSSEGIVLSGSIQQNNIFGSGKHVGATINSSSINTIYALSYTDPYFTTDGISQGFDIYYRDLNPYNRGLGRYTTTTMGGKARLGVPISEIDTISYSLGYEETKVGIFPDSPLFYKRYVETFGDQTSAVPATVGWARDGRDSLIYPTKGSLHRANAEVGIPGGNLHYYRLQYQYQRYFPLTRTYTFFLNGDVGYGDGYSDTPTLPFFKNFYAGGVSTVRGYRAFTIGPKDIYGSPLGGKQRVVGNAEFLMPFPGLENDKSVRVSAFVDAGNVGDSFDASLTRYSTGVAVLWVSPLGPLKISMAQPFNDQPDDRIQRFQFTFGSSF